MTQKTTAKVNRISSSRKLNSATSLAAIGEVIKPETANLKIDLENVEVDDYLDSPMKSNKDLRWVELNSDPISSLATKTVTKKPPPKTTTPVPKSMKNRDSAPNLHNLTPCTVPKTLRRERTQIQILRSYTMTTNR